MLFTARVEAGFFGAVAGVFFVALFLAVAWPLAIFLRGLAGVDVVFMVDRFWKITEYTVYTVDFQRASFALNPWCGSVCRNL